MSFRKNLEHLRKEMGLSQEDLAFKLNVSRQAVSKWESGGTYPETSKMLMMCKLFDCTLDELMQEDIAQLRSDEVKKYTVNDLIKEGTDLIRRSSDMINGMSRRGLLKFLFELFVLFILLSFIKIPFNNLYQLGWDVFVHFGVTVGGLLSAIWNIVVQCIYYIFVTILAVYIYKIRFLDKYEQQVERISENKKSQDIDIQTDEKKVEVTKYDFGIFSLIAKLGILGIKAFVFLLFIPTVIAILFSIAGLVINVSWIINGIVYLSISIFLISFIIFCATILYVGYNFILDLRSRWNMVFYILLVSVVGFGISMGVGALEIKNLTISPSVNDSIQLNTKKYEYKLEEDMFVFPYWNVEYIEDSSLKDSIKIEIACYEQFTECNVRRSTQEKNILIVDDTVKEISFNPIYSLFLDDLKNKVIHVNYESLFQADIKVYGSKENIQKMKKSIEKRYGGY